MISLDGAALLAQIIPVFVLIVAVERRGLGKIRASNNWRSISWYLARLIGTWAAVLGGTLAEMWCINAVCSGVPIDGWEAVTVSVGTLLVGLTAAFSALALLFTTFDDRIKKK